MAFRRTRNRHDRWQSHLRDHEELWQASGLPAFAHASERVLRQLLTRGSVGDPDSGREFTLDALDEQQFEALIELVLHRIPFDMDTLLFEAFERARQRSDLED